MSVEKEVKVCKDFFCKTICISHGPVDSAIAGMNDQGIYQKMILGGVTRHAIKHLIQNFKKSKNILKHFQLWNPTIQENLPNENTLIKN